MRHFLKLIIFWSLIYSCATTKEEEFRHKIDPRISSLLEQATAATQTGQYPKANFKLERAYRINPKEPFIYLGLARLRFEEKQYQESLGFISKGLRYIGRDKHLELEFWSLKSQNYEALGNKAKYEDAFSKVEKLQEQIGNADLVN